MSQPANEPKVEILKDIPRKEEFQKYLEKAGVIDQLTKLLVSLYENPDRPENALEYIRSFLGANSGQNDDNNKESQQRINDLEQQLKEKDEIIAQLQQQLSSQNKEEDNKPDDNEAENLD
mmetsp:Transcript_32018/g.51425  ORF Transcript_32018/g.51425 Transcript_32018/m.51425 type:complete len:120 (-) Transcript_32018:364-723(-)|eukprot:CAMPEP_0197022978 /NCGR_PEP_ID=MMETSP1384-20130603/3772_1 /TAXON_ID=29189 /ORGANISM="Ammonia sp." /LENGTH=119 /DNA_ID=CAMNT_0042451111 /DNA_START=149 /DNA_END=508 /DNA_ORIENTATION=+